MSYRTLGVINLMPRAEIYESFIRAIVPKGTQVVMIRARSHCYSSSNHAALNATHVPIDDCDLGSIDALLVSGAPLDQKQTFEETTYWNELQTFLREASGCVGGIGGICWGALAIAKIFFAVDKKVFARQLFGVYKLDVLCPAHPFMSGVGKYYMSPQSRYAEMDASRVSKLVAERILVALDWSHSFGYCTLTSSDSRLLMMQGHLDYPISRLAEEYFLKRATNSDALLPVAYDVYSPTHCWAEASQRIFDSWLRFASSERPHRK